MSISDRHDTKRVLFVATVDTHIWYFHMPFMQMLRNMGYEVEVAAGPSGFADAIIGQGFVVHGVAFSRNPLSPKNITAYGALGHLLHEKHYVMVHVHTPVAGFLGRLAAKREHVPHVIYTAHGFHFHRYGRWWSNHLYYALERLAGRWTDMLITINEEDYAAASSRFASYNTRVFYVPGVGTDCTAIQPADPEEQHRAKQQLEIGESRFSVSWIAEFIQRKRPFDALAAMQLLLSQVSSAILLMTGDGRLLRKMRSKWSPSGSSDQVRFLGRVGKAGIAQVLHASDVFLSTSIQEGLPKSIMEAMSAGLPVVSYDIRGCHDLVVDGETGFLVPFGDVGQLAERITWLAQHPEERVRMGLEGRRRVEEQFSLQVVLPQMRRLYEEELGEENK